MSAAASMAATGVISAEGTYRQLHSDRRRKLVSEAFSQVALATGGVFGICGPTDSGKTALALAVIDHAGRLGALPEDRLLAPNYALAGPEGFIVLCDEAERHDPEALNLLTRQCRGTVPLIICAREEETVRVALTGQDRLVRLKAPDAESLRSLLLSLDGPNLDRDQASRFAEALAGAGCGLRAARAVMRDALIAARIRNEQLQESHLQDAIMVSASANLMANDT